MTNNIRHHRKIKSWSECFYYFVIFVTKREKVGITIKSCYETISNLWGLYLKFLREPAKRSIEQVKFLYNAMAYRNIMPMRHFCMQRPEIIPPVKIVCSI